MTRHFLFSRTVVVFFVLAVLAAVELGGAGGCGTGTGGGPAGTTRNMAGTIDVNSLSGLTVRSRSQSRLAGLAVKLKNQQLSCSQVDLCCAGYDGTTTKATKNGCGYTIPLPLSTFCFCGLFTGTDEDGDGCGDDFIAELGCADRDYSGAIPVFEAADGSRNDIDLGTITVEGDKAVSSSDICAQVDSDGDGLDDVTDTDDDQDGVSDDEDSVCGGGCLEADAYDGDGDNIPDVYEGSWDNLDDTNGNNVPDFCDEELFASASSGGAAFTSCDATEEDTDGNCIPDAFDEGFEDIDRDGVAADDDCDDNDPAVTFECYGDICSLDDDGDGVTFCDDCDDGDADNTLTVENGCEVECPQSTACENDFECQLFAEDDQTDQFETDNVECRNGCCELK